MYIPGITRRFALPPPATLAHKEEQNKMRMKQREKLTTCQCKSSMHQDGNPDAACMYEIHGEQGRGERAVLYQVRYLVEIEGKSFARHISTGYLRSCIYLSAGRF